jgi:Pentapeptide repeats (9 copies)
MTIHDIDWPGPRPLSFDGAGARIDRLVGRERELAELLDVCQTYAVVEVTAASGVGKTSFVAGAAVHLRDAGAKVLRARPWSESLGDYDARVDSRPEPDPVALYCLALGLSPCADPAGLSDALHAQADGRPLVCILDQLEELLRYRRQLGRLLLELIGRTAGSSGIPHVLVARSEFRNELRPVEVPQAPTWHMLLSELTDPAVIRRVVEEPIPSDVAVEDEFVVRLVDWWTLANSPSSNGVATGAVGVGAQYGLLHLQALLWSFKTWATTTVAVERDGLRLADLERYASARGLDPAPANGAELMRDALFAYVEETIGRCTSERWPLGPRLMFARSARHLSSAGFKVPQTASALLSRAIQEELGGARPGPEVDARLRISSEGHGRREKAASIAERVPIEGAGLAVDWDAVDVAEEMVASLESALESLADDREANILRKFARGDDPVYELVHDGVAPVLDHWADDLLASPAATLGVISARRGEVFSHDLMPATFRSDERLDALWRAIELRDVDGVPVATIDGIKWRGLGVHQPSDMLDAPRPVTFERLHFRNCVFVGTLFLGALLQDVEFERCDLKGLAVQGCTLRHVTFTDCSLPGASLNDCDLDGVRFHGADRPDALSYVSISRTRPGARVEFRDLHDVTGLCLTRLSGGDWTFENVAARHLVLESVTEDELRLRFAGETVLRHVTIEGPSDATAVLRDPGVTIEPLTDANAVVPPDATAATTR